MSREERKLRKHLEAHARRELRKALSKARVKDWKPPRERVNINDDEEDYLPVKSYRTAALREPLLASDVAPVSTGFVAETGPGFCDILCGRERIRCRHSGDVSIGDRVLFSPDRHRIQEVLPRRTALSRADPHNPHIQRVIAANVDVVVNVVSLKTPPLRPGLIDRYLIAIGKSGAEPLLCVNKIDLLESAEELDAVRPYQDIGIPVILCSASTGAGLDELSGALAGKLCVLAGHSGVGKSSLLNALDPQLQIATGSVSEANEKGRHTTTSSALYRLPNGATVIDTPGIREFGLWDITRDDLRHYYQEFGAYQCAFADCTHVHEPDCAVKRAVASGAISEARYESYARILASLAIG
ncbi:MAG TPA: ribosome small subunit-dependent GTPase A [Bryobacteraceae bacterium]|jgi:ribosome biogenesis GTPase|nr:ribosome small subunit-dependent GTPase A [Bryobacteraceae bacterium]